MAALHPNLAASTPLTNKEGKENKRAEPAPLAREPRKPHRERSGEGKIIKIKITGQRS